MLTVAGLDCAVRQLDQMERKTTLVVCQNTLVAQWADEVKKYAPNLKVCSGASNVCHQLLLFIERAPPAAPRAYSDRRYPMTEACR